MNRRLIESMTILDNIKNDCNKCGVSESNTNLLIDSLKNKILEANDINQVRSIGIMGEIKAMIQRLVAWLFGVLNKIKNMFSKDYAFLKKYSKQLALNAHILNKIQIELPRITDLKNVCDTNQLFRIPDYTQDDQYYKVISSRVEKANSMLRTLVTTTIGDCGGIRAIIKGMEDNTEYEKIAGFKNMIEGFENLNLDIQHFDGQEPPNMIDISSLWIKAMQDVLGYMFNMAIAKQKAYKAALIKAIAASGGVKQEALIGALEASNNVMDRFMNCILEAFSDNVLGTLDTVDVTNVNALPILNNDSNKILNVEDVIDKEKLAEYVCSKLLGNPYHEVKIDINRDYIREFNDYWIHNTGLNFV